MERPLEELEEMVVAAETVVADFRETRDHSGEVDGWPAMVARGPVAVST